VLQTPPEATEALENRTDRVYQLGSNWPYLQYLSRGWEDTNYYRFALNSLDANSNLLWGINQVNAYEGVLTQRQEIFQTLLQHGFTGDLESFLATPSALGQRFLNLSGAKYLISPFLLNDPALPLAKKIAPPEGTSWPPFYIYRNKTALPRARLVTDWQTAADMNSVAAVLSGENFPSETTAVLEGAFWETTEKSARGRLQVLQDEDGKIIVETQTDGRMLLVLADSFYPGWQAFVDDRPTEIYPANINQRAIFLPAGKHRVHFVYAPSSVQIGLLVSGAAWAFWLGWAVWRLILRTRNVK
jgi:hypothetical protein